jgi:hypothetical protein
LITLAMAGCALAVLHAQEHTIISSEHEFTATMPWSYIKVSNPGGDAAWIAQTPSRQSGIVIMAFKPPLMLADLRARACEILRRGMNKVKLGLTEEIAQQFIRPYKTGISFSCATDELGIVGEAFSSDNGNTYIVYGFSPDRDFAPILVKELLKTFRSK